MTKQTEFVLKLSLFAGMPPFDLDMLFEDEVAPE